METYRIFLFLSILIIINSQQCLPPCLTCNSAGSCITCQPNYLPNPISNVCVLCSSNCQTCQNSPLFCTSCKSGFVLNPTAGVCNQNTCPQGYYLSIEGTACLACFTLNNNCYTCEQNRCLSCIGAYFPSGRDCLPCPIGCSYCKSEVQCIQNITGNGVNSNNITANNTQSTNASNSSNNNPPQILSAEFCQQNTLCINCNGVICEGCYGSNYPYGSECLGCQLGCISCSTGTNCLIAKSIKYMSGIIYDQSSNQYQHCGIGCLSCSRLILNSFPVCSASALGFYLQSGVPKKCQRNCLSCQKLQNTNICNTCPGSYAPTLAGTCSKCPNNCLQCSSNNLNICQSCNLGFFLQSNQCTRCNTNNCRRCSSSSCLECQDGHYLDLNNAKCFQCLPQCSKCSAGNISKCQGCSSGYFLSAYGTCSVCPVGCSECISDKNCSKCLSGYQFTSQSVCSNICSAQCLTCRFDNPSICTSCTSEYSFDAGNGRCIPKLQCTFGCNSCAFGYFLTENNACSNCLAPNCASCNVSGSVCAHCFRGYYLTSNNLCSSCPVGCEACISSQICLGCSAGYYLLDQQPGPCNRCSEQCSTCLKNSNLCLNCSEGYEKIGWKCFLKNRVYAEIGLSIPFSQFISTRGAAAFENYLITQIQLTNPSLFQFFSIKQINAASQGGSNGIVQMIITCATGIGAGANVQVLTSRIRNALAMGTIISGGTILTSYVDAQCSSLFCSNDQTMTNLPNTNSTTSGNTNTSSTNGSNNTSSTSGNTNTSSNSTNIPGENSTNGSPTPIPIPVPIPTPSGNSTNNGTTNSTGGANETTPNGGQPVGNQTSLIAAQQSKSDLGLILGLAIPLGLILLAIILGIICFFCCFNFGKLRFFSKPSDAMPTTSLKDIPPQSERPTIYKNGNNNMKNIVGNQIILEQNNTRISFGPEIVNGLAVNVLPPKPPKPSKPNGVKFQGYLHTNDFITQSNKIKIDKQSQEIIRNSNQRAIIIDQSVNVSNKTSQISNNLKTSRTTNLKQSPVPNLKTSQASSKLSQKLNKVRNLNLQQKKNQIIMTKISQSKPQNRVITIKNYQTIQANPIIANYADISSKHTTYQQKKLLDKNVELKSSKSEEKNSDSRVQHNPYNHSEYNEKITYIERANDPSNLHNSVVQSINLLPYNSRSSNITPINQYHAVTKRQSDGRRTPINFLSHSDIDETGASYLNRVSNQRFYRFKQNGKKITQQDRDNTIGAHFQSRNYIERGQIGSLRRHASFYSNEAQYKQEILQTSDTGGRREIREAYRKVIRPDNQHQVSYKSG